MNVTTFPAPEDFDAEGALIRLTATLADRALYPAGDDARADMNRPGFTGEFLVQ